MTSTDELAGLAQMKQMTRATWAAGDFSAVARRFLWDVGEHLVQRVGVGINEDVLDIACGTGNAAIRAAQAGGHVVGVDLTPELFEAGKDEAAHAGVTLDWVEGDAEELPFEDASFDVVLSTFGVMFAPRHQVAAAELVRVLRPGGRFGLTTWTPEGAQGVLFRMLAQYAPPAPPFAQPPLAWGAEDHVREIFEGTGVHLEFERNVTHAEPFASGDEAFDWGVDKFGPLVRLRPMLEQRGEWDAFREQQVAYLAQNVDPEYLIILGRKP